MKNFTNIIKENIEKNNIKPLPKYYFIIKNILFAIIFLISIFFGSIVTSLIIYSVLEGGFEGIDPIYTELIKSLPFIWIFFFCIFSIIALWGIKHFPKTYKFSSTFFILINILLTLFLGIILYFFEFPETFEKYERHIPFHTPVEKNILKKWNDPQKGFLSGEVIDINLENNEITVKNIENKVWKVIINKRIKDKILHEKKKLIDKKIKIRGEISEFSKSEENIFNADHILPLKRNRFKPKKDNVFSF